PLRSTIFPTRRSSDLQLQEQFVALAGHELRTPLTALRGSIQLLQRIASEVRDERVGRYIRLALAQERLLADLVQDLTDVIRVQTDRKSTRLNSSHVAI